MKFDKEELKLLNTSKGLEYLLHSEQPNFRDTVNRLKYDKALAILQTQLIKVQNSIVEQKEHVVILVEGREFAGKGSAIRTFSEHLNPRHMRIVALKKPSITERDQWYFKRYISQLPERGQMVFFDRSWYNRAIVEPVNGFCTQKEYDRFIDEVNLIEEMLQRNGTIIIKLYLSITKEEQNRRIMRAQENPLRSWELSPVDLKAIELWDKYTEYEKKMLAATDTTKNPWYIFDADDTRTAHLQAIEKIIDIYSQVSGSS